jgi:hypothetical protein
MLLGNNQDFRNANFTIGGVNVLNCYLYVERLRKNIIKMNITIAEISECYSDYVSLPVNQVDFVLYVVTDEMRIHYGPSITMAHLISSTVAIHWRVGVFAPVVKYSTTRSDDVKSSVTQESRTLDDQIRP